MESTTILSLHSPAGICICPAIKGKAQHTDAIRNKIHEAGVQTSVHYPAIHRFSIYKEYGAVLPQTEYVTDHEITLPMYAALTMEDVEYIVKVVDTAVNG